MKYPQSRLLVFCKAPQPGKVKTRLAKDIGELAATTVHQYLAQHCIQQLVGFQIAPVEIWCAPDTDHELFQQCKKSLGVSLRTQVGDDLGQRMRHAFDDTLSQHSPVVVVGTDCPVLTEDYLHSAFAAASQNKTVIAPAEDGGYVLLGMNDLQHAIFSEIPWGTSQVFPKTVERLTGEVEILEPLWDVDYVADLRRLCAASGSLQLSEDFRGYLERLNLS